MKRGFTLVELSIVLVIIGLLIGGILSAQSLITTAKISSQVRQFQQFDAAIANFQGKYRGLPGDSSQFNGIGNDDGIIQSVTTASYPEFTGEMKMAWSDLQAGERMFSGKTLDTTDYCGGTGCKFTGATINIPASAISQKSGVLIGSDDGFVVIDGNAYIVAPYDGSGGNAEESSRNIPCVDTLALDKKLDDANPSAGNLRADNCGGATYTNITSEYMGLFELKILSQTGQ